MRITFVIRSSGLSGGVRVVAIYAARLAARGHDVTVISRSFPRGPTLLRRLVRWRRGGRKYTNTTAFDRPDIRHIVVDRAYPFHPDDIPDADVIIASWWETAFAVADLPASKGRKFYFVQHHEVHDFLPRHLTRGSYHLPLKKITIAEWLVETMARDYGDRDVALVENSVDMGQFHAPERPKNARPTVGLLYSTTPFKGVSVSLAAIERARQRVPDLQVIAFGTAPVSPDLALPPGSHFELQPPQARLRELYAMCDVWLCGSWTEGFHLPPLEAMACRCPVVATRVGGTVETVIEGVNGHLVAPGDAEALGDRLADVLTLAPESWKAMSDAALARAQSYTWDDATDRFEAALRDGTVGNGTVEESRAGSGQTAAG